MDQDNAKNVADELRELYPGRLALLLVELCNPNEPHEHGGDPCKKRGKKPLGADWNVKAVARWRGDDAPARHLERMAAYRRSGFNVGWTIPPGVVVLDADDAESSARISAIADDPPMQESAHGAHFVFKAPPGLEIRQQTKVALADGITVDLRCAGAGQIVCQPSVHESGVPYTWKRELPADLKTLPELPGAWVDALKTAARTTATAPDGAAGGIGRNRIEEGRRNGELFRIGSKFRGQGLVEEAIDAQLQAVNRDECDPPLSEHEVRRIAAQCAKYEPNGEQEDAAPLAMPELVSLEEFIADENPEAILEGLVYAGVPTTLHGVAKTGKTYLICQLVLSVADEKPFLDQQPRRGRVLYCSWELTTAALRKRMVGIASTFGLSSPVSLMREGWLHFFAHRKHAEAMPVMLDTEEGRRRFEHLARKASAEVIVIDTLSKCASLQPFDDEGWKELIRWLGRFARTTGIAVLVIDHSHRNRAEFTASTSAYGSQTKGQAFAAIAGLTVAKRDDDPAERIWRLDSECWFGDVEPVYYRRPQLEDGSLGVGCEPCESPESGGAKTKGQEAADWLRTFFENRAAQGIHWVPKADVVDSSDFSARTVERAFQGIRGNHSRRVRPRGPAWWSLTGGGEPPGGSETYFANSGEYFANEEGEMGGSTPPPENFGEVGDVGEVGA